MDYRFYVVRYIFFIFVFSFILSVVRSESFKKKKKEEKLSEQKTKSNFCRVIIMKGFPIIWNATFVVTILLINSVYCENEVISIVSTSTQPLSSGSTFTELCPCLPRTICPRIYGTLAEVSVLNLI